MMCGYWWRRGLVSNDCGAEKECVIPGREVGRIFEQRNREFSRMLVPIAA
jgi:hypothetical protein